MRFPFRRKALTGGGDVPAAIRSGWSAVANLGGGAQQRIQNAFTRAQNANLAWLYENSPALRTVIDTIVRNIGQLELRLYEEVSESERQPQPDHPAALSLRYPNSDVSSDEFVRQLVQDFLIYDNAYALVTPAAGSQLSFNWLPAPMIAVLGSSLFTAEIYRFWRSFAGGFYQPAGQPYQDFSPDQILHWHGRNPNDPRVGYSRLETLRGVLAEDVAMRQALLELAQAGLQEPVWVARPLDAPDWSNDARRGFEEEISARIRRRNTTVPVLEEGMELKSFGVTPHDAEMMEVRRWVYSQIAGAFGLPLGMIGLGATPQEDQMRFYSDCLYPLCRELSKFLDHRILVGAYGWLEGSFEFQIDEKFMGDDRIRTLTSAAGAPIMLRDEARAKLSLPPLPGGVGKEPVIPLNIQEESGASTGKPSIDVMPVQDPNGPLQDGSYRTGEPQKALEMAMKMLTGLASQPLGGGQRAELPIGTDPNARLPQFLPSFAGDIDRQRRHIDQTKAVVQRMFNRIGHVAQQKAAVSNRDWNRWQRELSADLDKTLHGIVGSEGSLYTMKLGGTGFDVGEVTNYLRAMSEGAAGALLETVRGEVDQLGADKALARASQHVASMGTSLGARVTIWARDEAAKQTPGYEGRVKTWIADTGRHADLNGQTVAIGADWPGGFGPGQQPGCACTQAIR